MAPKQAMACTIMQDTSDYAAEATAGACKLGLPADAVLRNKSINDKLRKHSRGHRFTETVTLSQFLFYPFPDG